jgi:large subunit ribosomal protein LP0
VWIYVLRVFIVVAEMISRVHLIHKGTKVTDSQAALLQKLSIKPFSYGLVVTKVR